MEVLLSLISEHAMHAHWVLFVCLILAGLNVPISEDILLIVGGVLASTVVPSSALKIFIAVFAGAYLSDSLAYWLGRGLGPRLWNVSWFRRFVRKKRLHRIEQYYRQYGVSTLLLGRFIPFGVRNCLFMAAGMARMPFSKFLVVDAIACLASNSLVFWLAFAFGKNYHTLLGYLEVADILIFAAFVVALIGLIWYKKSKKAVSE